MHACHVCRGGVSVGGSQDSGRSQTREDSLSPVAVGTRPGNLLHELRLTLYSKKIRELELTYFSSEKGLGVDQAQMHSGLGGSLSQ